MDSNTSLNEPWKDFLGNVSSIHPDTVFGKDVTIGRDVIILENCKVGDNVRIEHFVLLKEHTFVGNNCFIDSFVRSSGYNVICNNVTIRFGSTICKESVIEDDVFISPNVMTIYSTHKGKGVSGVVIGKGSFIGTSAVISAGVKICPGTVIGAMSLVTKDITEKGIYTGIPAKLVKPL